MGLYYGSTTSRRHLLTDVTHVSGFFVTHVSGCALRNFVRATIFTLQPVFRRSHLTGDGPDAGMPLTALAVGVFPTLSNNGMGPPSSASGHLRAGRRIIVKSAPSVRSWS